MSGQNVSHRIIETKNKHSRAVLKDGTIEIRLARRLHPQEKEQHIQELLARMTKAAMRQQARTVINPFSEVDGPGLYTICTQHDQKITIELTEGSETKLYKKSDQNWNGTIKNGFNKEVLKKLLWRKLGDYMNNFFIQEVQAINRDTFQVPLTKISNRYAKTVWGSCAHHGGIMLNTALLFVPPHLLTYVIIHELAHRLEANHSPKFWAQVERFCPTYKEDRKELRGYTLR